MMIKILSRILIAIPLAFSSIGSMNAQEPPSELQITTSNLPFNFVPLEPGEIDKVNEKLELMGENSLTCFDGMKMWALEEYLFVTKCREKGKRYALVFSVSFDYKRWKPLSVTEITK